MIDLEDATGRLNRAVGVSGVLLGEVLGVEADVGYAPAFFQAGNQSLVVASHATTFTGNVVVAVPQRLTRYTLRPYVVGGAGLMHATSALLLVPVVSATLPAMDVGGGATGFLSRRIGLGWDVRYFRSVGTGQERGQSSGPEQLSFWRVNMAIAIRY